MGSRLHETFAKAYQDGTSPPERPRNIDPKAPIASLAAGPQQFTAIADTDHGSGKIRESLAQEIPRLAQAGVKHLMLEFYINPVGSPYRTNISEQIENILFRLNSRPPTITEREILAQSPLFTSVHEKEETNETGTACAHLLVAAMKHGIIVHFAGDDKYTWDKREAERLQIQYENYKSANADLEEYAKKLEQDPQQYLNLSQEDMNTLIYRMELYSSICNDFQTAIIKHLIASKEKNLSPETENERASRFISLAQGEKSVVVFGREHFRKERDINEAIDNQLKSQALAKGQKIPEKTAVAEIWDSRAEHKKWLTTYADDKISSRPPDLRIFADTGAVEIPKEFAQVYTFGAVTPQHPAQNAPSSANVPRP